MKKTIVVFGTARSGTSMTCGVLERMGVHIWYQPSAAWQLEFNPTGAYEYDGDQIIGVEIDKWSHANITFQELYEKTKPIVERYIERQHDLWGFKTPGLNALPVLARMFPDIHVVATFRNIFDQAQSYKLLRPLPPDSTTYDLLEEMATNNLIMIQKLRKLDLPTICVTFAGLRHETAAQVEYLARKLGINLSPDMMAAIESFVRPNQHTWIRE